MNTLLFVLINGFLFSISSSSVTTNNSTNPLPVIQEDCQDAKKPIPFVQPEFPQPLNNGSTQKSTEEVKPTFRVSCPDSDAC